MKKSNRLIMIILLAALLLFGGYYAYSKSLLIVLMAAFIIWKSLDTRSFIRVRVSTLGAVGLCGIISMFFAADKSANFEGLVGIMVLIAFRFLADNIGEKEREISLGVIPISGAVMTLLGLVVLVNDSLASLLWKAERFGGIFQYSNTCALYLLIGLMIIEGGQEYKKIWKHIMAVILLLGILLTGSRTIAVFTIIFAIVCFIKNKNERGIILGFSLGAAALALGYVVIFNSFQNLGRIFTIFTANSTLFGRILYNMDGLRMLLKHPLGQGYLGYYYTKGLYQTGVYEIRFVHNDILQTGLDYGIVAMLLLVIAIVLQLVRGKQSFLKKEILLLIAVASLTDFHLQYSIIGMIAVLCCDFDKDIFPWIKELTKDKILISVTGLILVVWAGALSIGYLSINAGDYETALKIMSFNTEAMTEKLANTEDISDARILVGRILKSNPYNMEALNAQIYIDLMEEDYALLVYDVGRVQELDPYNVSLYKRYDELMLSAQDKLMADGNENAASVLDAGRQELRGRLAKLEERTSKIAFRLNEKPVFNY